MLKVDHIETYGWEVAIRGMRNPKNSWDKSDSIYCRGASEVCDTCYLRPDDDYAPCYVHDDSIFVLGKNDMKLMTTLADAGQVHGKFLRMIVVTMDITAPLYWWKEFDTYKVGTVANSCSTMHKIHSKEFTADDFSHEHLLVENAVYFGKTIERLNHARNKFLETKDKNYWWQMIQLLPSSYNQKRTVMLNYAVCKNIYEYRHNHKLDEWHVLCDAIAKLPYAKELIIGTKE